MDWMFIFSTAAKSAIGLETIVFAMAAIGLNMHFGYTGLLNFGQAAFVGIAAYGLAITVTIWGLPFWLGIAVGLIGAVLLALILGIPTLRLRADYLAIVTIAAAEIFRLIVRSASLSDQTGGSNGISAFSDGFYDLNPLPGDFSFKIGTITVGDREAWALLVGWLLAALCTAFVWLLIRSPWGRVLKAIREDEDAVRSLGKNVYSYKMQSLVIGGVIGALAGFVYALGRANVQPDLYGTELTFFAYTVLILGGAARVFGPIVGSIVFWVVLSLTDSILREAIGAGFIPTDLLDTSAVGQVRYILVGIALMLLMIFRPQGIFGDRKELALDGR